MAKKALILAILLSVLLSLVLCVGCDVEPKNEAGNPAEENSLPPSDTGGIPGDTTAPVISSAKATEITATSVKIAWLTDEPSSSGVEYGLTSLYGSASPTDNNLVTNHSVVLDRLPPGTTYHFRVKSQDAAANEALSGDGVFTTVPTTQPYVAPLANAGLPQDAITGVVVTLDGSASTVAPGKTISYSWAITSTPAGSAVSITNPTTAKPAFTPDVAGTYTFTLTVSDGYSNAVATVKVTADSLNSITVAPTDRTISLGQTRQYLATGVFTIAGSKDISTAVNWASSNTAVATIGSSGLATSAGEGTTIISATMAGQTAATTLTVGPVTLVSIAIDEGHYVQLFDGQTLQLHLTATYSNGTTSDITEQATWSVPFFDADTVSVSNDVGNKGFVTTLGVLGVAQVHADYLDFGEVIFISVT